MGNSSNLQKITNQEKLNQKRLEQLLDEAQLGLARAVGLGSLGRAVGAAVGHARDARLRRVDVQLRLVRVRDACDLQTRRTPVASRTIALRLEGDRRLKRGRRRDGDCGAESGAEGGAEGGVVDGTDRGHHRIQVERRRRAVVSDALDGDRDGQA